MPWRVRSHGVGKLENDGQRARGGELLGERLSRLGQAGQRINESLDLDTAFQADLDSARSLTAARYGVLYQLAAQAPNVLTHGLLLSRVWGPERAGGGWLLRNVVKKLRRKLGEDADNPVYIFTKPRVGYRMAAGEGGSQQSGVE